MNGTRKCLFASIPKPDIQIKRRAICIFYRLPHIQLRKFPLHPDPAIIVASTRSEIDTNKEYKNDKQFHHEEIASTKIRKKTRSAFLR